MEDKNTRNTNSIRYIIMRNHIKVIEVILANRTIMHTGNEAAKSSSGYHLNGLFVGSEGTLGCFTELTLKVYGIPEHTMAARASFGCVDHAVEAVVAVLQAGIPVARVELVDEQAMKQINLYSDTNYEEVPTLFMEFHGNEAGLKQDVAIMRDIVAD